MPRSRLSCRELRGAVHALFELRGRRRGERVRLPSCLRLQHYRRGSAAACVHDDRPGGSCLRVGGPPLRAGAHDFERFAERANCGSRECRASPATVGCCDCGRPRRRSHRALPRQCRIERGARELSCPFPQSARQLPNEVHDLPLPRGCVWIRRLQRDYRRKSQLHRPEQQGLHTRLSRTGLGRRGLVLRRDKLVWHRRWCLPG
mmetsp:Transcript_17665/g.42253  ORF Transcript_17665/g.42253 Transcript_17665/m.42253 type:complete len:204 (-) Transcript_17665:1061-1672(-)